MKRVIFFCVLLCTFIVGSVSWESKASSGINKQRAITKFDQPVALLDVMLKGEYLFVHDDVAMREGKACTYVYKGNAEIRDKLVISFHCNPVERKKAEGFQVRTIETSPGVIELREFQFGGDTESHAVPTSVHAHIDMN